MWVIRWCGFHSQRHYLPCAHIGIRSGKFPSHICYTWQLIHRTIFAYSGTCRGTYGVADFQADWHPIGFSRILISIDSKILCCCGSHLCHNRCLVKWTLYFFWINVTCFRWVMFSLTASIQSSFYVSITQDKLEAGVRLSHYMHSYGDRPNDYESVSKC